jgi:type I restriction enzyme S subunit
MFPTRAESLENNPPRDEERVISTLKAYAAYKDSGVPWLGQVPEHWDVRRFKYLLRERDMRSAEGVEQLLRVSQFTGVTERRRTDGGGEPDTRAESLIGYKRVEPNDLVVNIMLAWNGSVGVSSFPGIVSPAYCVYRFNASAQPWYFHHLLRSPAYKARIKAVSTGVVESRLRLYSDDLYRLEGLLPPLAEQTAIVRFLDYMDRRIRRVIHARQRQIKLLEEYRQALIHQAVTGQIDVRTGKPYPAYKDSGVPWLGQVPEHWEVCNTRDVAQVINGYPFDSSKFSQTIGIPLIRIRDLNKTRTTVRYDGAFVESARVNPGDVLIGMDGDFTVGTWRGSEPALLNQRMCCVRAANAATERFLAYLLPLPLKEINEVTWSTTVKHLSSGQVERFKFALPPLPEQTAIVDYLDAQTAKNDAAIAATRREIELLREYRERLIADVVTGKVDVREVAARLPEEPPEEKGEADIEPMDEDHNESTDEYDETEESEDTS